MVVPRGPVSVRRRALLAGLMVLVATLTLPRPATAAYETLKVLGGSKEFAPGGSIRLLGHSWFGPISTCKNRVAITLKDARRKQHKLGTIGPEHTGVIGRGGQTVQNLWDIAGTVRVPQGGVAAGPAELLALQRIKYRFPIGGFPCIQLARKQARAKGLTIVGAVGDDPPEIAKFAVPDMRQGAPGTIVWDQSEAGQAVLKLTYLFTSDVELRVATLVDEQRPAGANAFGWDATVGGNPLPVGRYRLQLQIRDSSGALSTPAFAEFTVAFG